MPKIVLRAKSKDAKFLVIGALFARKLAPSATRQKGKTIPSMEHLEPQQGWRQLIVRLTVVL